MTLREENWLCVLKGEDLSYFFCGIFAELLVSATTYWSGKLNAGGDVWCQILKVVPIEVSSDTTTHLSGRNVKATTQLEVLP